MCRVEDDHWDRNFVTEFCKNIVFSRKASYFHHCQVQVDLNLEGLCLMAPNLEGKAPDVPTTSKGYMTVEDKFQ